MIYRLKGGYQVLEFGDGDILLGIIGNKESHYTIGLGFSQGRKGKRGRISKRKWEDKTPKELKMYSQFWFKSVESLDIVIKKLQEVKDIMNEGGE